MNIKKFFLTMPVIAAVCLSVPVCTAFAADNVPADDEIIEDAAAEEVPITDGIRRGEGYYEGVVIYRDGIDCVYDDGGNAYALIGGVSGNLKDGETRESVEKEMTESIRYNISAAGKDPDDYAFDVYVYLYDDYDYSPQEFLDFVTEEVSARKSGNASPNPPTGTKTAVPFAACTAAVFALLAAACTARKKYTEKY